MYKEKHVHMKSHANVKFWYENPCMVNALPCIYHWTCYRFVLYIRICSYIHSYINSISTLCENESKKVHIHTYMHTCIHTHIHLYIIHMYIHTYMHKYTYVHIYTYIDCIGYWLWVCWHYCHCCVEHGYWDSCFWLTVTQKW